METVTRVLLVEDNEDDAVLTRDVLQGRGDRRYEIHWISTYEEAREAVLAGDYDVALLDYHLGVSNGLDLLREAQAAGVRRPLLLLTGQEDERIDQAALEAGAMDFLTKSELTPALLGRSIRYAINSKQEQVLLQDREAELRALIHGNPDVIARFDREFRHLFVSSAVERATGLAAAQFLGRTHEQLGMSESLCCQWDAALERCFRTGEQQEIEFAYPTPTGERAFHARLVPERASDGSVASALAISRDITVLREATRANQRFAAAFDNLSVGVLITDPAQPDNPIIYANPGFSSLTQYPLAEVLGRNCRFLQGSDTDPEAAAEIRACIAERRTFSGTLLNYKQDATQFWNELVISPVFDAAGELINFVGIQTDVTTQRRAEAEVREAKQQLETFLDAIPDPAWLKDPTGRYVAVNDACTRIRGLPRTEILGKTDDDLFPPTLAEQLRSGDEQASAEGRVVLEEDHTTRPGVKQWFSVTRAPLPDGAGVVGIAHDVTERKRAELAIHSANETLQALIEAMPLAVCTLDSERRVTMWNPAAERIYGWSAAEIVGQVYPLVPVDRESEHQRMFQGAMEEGLVQTGFETIRHRKDGRRIEVSISSAPLRDRSGAIRAIIGMYADVTERKNLAEQLRLSQRLEAVGRLAGGVAHDFNNLLMVIGANTRLALEDLPEDSPVRDDLEEVSRATGRAADLTRQLLAFSRKQILQPQLLDLTDVVTRTEKMLRRVIGEDLELITILDPNLGTVEADPSQMDQVLMNLCVNARDAMPTGGTLLLTTTDASITPEQAQRHAYEVAPGEYVVLSVEDTGCGMDEETIEQIFEPFFSTKGEMGTGLGLATVYGIIKQSGGYIWAESSPGGGTAFHIFLPRVERAAPVVDTSHGRVSPFQGSGESILLVEDEVAVRQITTRVLQRGGYRVLAAGDAEEALRVAEENQGKIDLVLTDVVMPKASGPEMVERFRERFPGVKVLYMSGYTDDALLRHGVCTSQTHFLQKPVAPELLLETVAALLARPDRGRSAPPAEHRNA